MSADVLKKALLRLYDGEGRIAGVGFLVTAEGHILTCAHVVGEAETVSLDFPFLSGGGPRAAQVLRRDGERDLALLVLKEDPPPESRPVRLRTASDLWGHPLRVFGFPPGHPKGVWVEGVLRDRIADQGWIQIEGTRQTGYWVWFGFSGSPVWDDRLGAVVGMTVETEGQAEVRAAFCVPTEVLQAFWAELPVEVWGKLFGDVPELPRHFVPRERDLAGVRRMLLDPGQGTVAIVGVRGMGGIGKTVLAAALVRDPQVRAAFPDGIVWVPLGREADVVARQMALASFFTGRQDVVYRDPGHGRMLLRPLLEDKAVLVVLDDVWRFEDADAFRVLGEKGRLLITTRNQRVLERLEARVCSLDVLSEDEALRLLADWAGQPVEELPPEARQVAKECGYLPLALAMVGALVRRNPESWARALRWLQKADLEKLRSLFPDFPHENLMVALDVSVEALAEGIRERYLDLAVFPEEVPIPRATLNVFWAPLGLDEDDVFDLAEEFVDRSLARWADEEKTALVLHDLQHDYVRAMRKERLPELHRRLLRAYAAKLGAPDYPEAPAPWHRLDPGDPYIWDHLVHHHIRAGWWDALYRLLTDFDFLEARCRATSPYDLEGDYRRALASWPEGKEEQKRILAAFEERVRLEASRIAQAVEWLFPALYNYLVWYDGPKGLLKELCEKAAAGRRNWLRSLQDPRPQPPLWLRSLEGHTRPVDGVAVTPDGRYVISGSSDRTVKIWDIESGQLLRSLRGHTAPVRAVAVTPDGRYVISSSSDRTVKIWSLETGQLLRGLEGHTAPVRAVVVTPDGHYVISGSSDRIVKIWDLETGRLLRSLEGHAGWVRAVAVTPDGRYVVSGSSDNTVRVWDLETGRLLYSLEGHAREVRAVAVTPDGRYVVSGADDNTVKIWDLETGRSLRSLEGHTRDVNMVVVSLDGRYAVSGSSDRTVKVWDLETGRLLRSFEDHTAPVNAVALSPDGKRVVSGSRDGTVKIWNLETDCLLRTLEGHAREVNAVAVSPDGRYVVSGSSDRTLRIWDLETGQPLRSLEGHARKVRAVAVTPDGRYVISGSSDRTVKIWDIESGELLHSLKGHAKPVRAVAVSPDGRYVVSGSSDRTLRIWDLETGQPLRSLEGHARAVNAVVVTRDGRYVVSGSSDRTVKIWDLAADRPPRSLEGHTAPVRALAVSPDGRYVISGSSDRTVKIWELESARSLRPLEGHTREVRAVAVTPDGRYVVSGADDNTVKIWDLTTGRFLGALEGHTAPVKTVAVGPHDGRYVVSGSSDRTVKIWDLVTGTLLHSLEGHTASVSAVAVSPDGKRVVSGSGDRTVKIWELETGRLLCSLEGHTDWVRTVAVSSDGRYVVSGSSDNTVKVWDLETGRFLRSLEAHTRAINAVTVTPDRSRIFSASDDGTVKVWALETGRLLCSLEAHTGVVLNVVVSSDGRYVVSGSSDNTLRVWELETTRTQLLFWNDAPILSLALSPDGRYLACGDTQGRVWIFEWVR